MFDHFPFFPEAASTIAPEVDKLYLFMVVVCGGVSLLVGVLVIYFAIVYRRRPENEIPVEYEPYHLMEALWIIIPGIVFIGMFLWGAKIFFMMSSVPRDALEINVTGRQWMWKFQHMGGQSEINQLHVPIGRPVKLLMSSEDVIHSFYVPAFRQKTDVLPRRVTTYWFQATKTGTFHLFCAEYCGTNHSGMVGWVTVMQAADYQAWLGGGTEGSPVVEGKRLFDHYACNTCHTNDTTARGPVLAGLFGSTVSLRGGAKAVADENYIHESILNSQVKIVDGFEPIMPLFQGQMSESQVLQLIAYIKSLTPQKAAIPPISNQTPGTSVANPGTAPANSRTR
ncbi:MAG TPA: cytochrome c oxidase subunit II [Thermoanaerobaculia bacterium]|nr:cytochrome c oxidase subunit II [Thermoanaerobaculia bacterium]